MVIGPCSSELELAGVRCQYVDQEALPVLRSAVSIVEKILR